MSVELEGMTPGQPIRHKATGQRATYRGRQFFPDWAIVEVEGGPLQIWTENEIEFAENESD
jgi:hypothetical protein